MGNIKLQAKGRPSLRQKIFLAVVGVVAGLLIMEIGVRLLVPHPDYGNMFAPDSKMGLRAKPGLVTRSTNPVAEFDVEVRINQEGFRDRDHPLAKPADTIRVAFLGDSFVFAQQVEESEMFVHIMENLLNADTGKFKGKKIEFMNFAISGFDTQQELLCYNAYVRKYKPDIVVLEVYVHNDFTSNLFYKEDNRLFGRPYFKLVDHRLEKIEANEAILQANYKKIEKQEELTLMRRSHLYNLMRDLFGRFAYKLKVSGKTQAFKLDPSDPKSVEQFWKLGAGRYQYYVVPANSYVKEVDEITRLLMRKLKESVEADGTVFLVADLPAKENVWPERWPEISRLYTGLDQFQFDFDRPFVRTREFLPELAARGDVFDARPSLRKAGEAGPMFFKNDFHFTPAGHRAVAEGQAEWLLEKIIRLQRERASTSKKND